MEGPVCTGAIFSKFHRFFFRAGGGKGLTPSSSPQSVHLGMNPSMLQQANPPDVMGRSFTDSHLKDLHAVFVQNEMVPIA